MDDQYIFNEISCCLDNYGDHQPLSRPPVGVPFNTTFESSPNHDGGATFGEF